MKCVEPDGESDSSVHAGTQASASTSAQEEPHSSGQDASQSPSVAAVLGNHHLLRIVLAQLGLQDLCRASSTCRDWLTVCNSDEFWRKVSLEGRVCRPAQVCTEGLPELEHLTPFVSFQP